MIDCLGRVVKEECGSTASDLTKTLFELVIRRLEHIRESELGGGENGEDDEDGEDDDDEQKQQSTLPENG